MKPEEAKKEISDILFEYFTKENIRSDDVEKKIMKILDEIGTN